MYIKLRKVIHLYWLGCNILCGNGVVMTEDLRLRLLSVVASKLILLAEILLIFIIYLNELR